MLLHPEMWPDVPPVFHYQLSFQSLNINHNLWDSPLYTTFSLEHSSTTLSQHLSFPPWAWHRRKMAALWLWSMLVLSSSPEPSASWKWIALTRPNRTVTPHCSWSRAARKPSTDEPWLTRVYRCQRHTHWLRQKCLCVYFLTLFLMAFFFPASRVSVLGLPVGQQRPPGSPPARPQRSGGRAGARGGDGPAEKEPDGQHCTHTKGKRSTWCTHINPSHQKPCDPKLILKEVIQTPVKIFTNKKRCK